jgi:hypothetical protein
VTTIVLAGSALTAARAALPWWASYGVLGWLPVFALLALLLTWLALLVAAGPLRALPADAHWTERARRLAPLRTTARAVPWLAAGGRAAR